MCLQHGHKMPIESINGVYLWWWSLRTGETVFGVELPGTKASSGCVTAAFPWLLVRVALCCFKHFLLHYFLLQKTQITHYNNLMVSPSTTVPLGQVIGFYFAKKSYPCLAWLVVRHYILPITYHGYTSYNSHGLQQFIGIAMTIFSPYPFGPLHRLEYWTPPFALVQHDIIYRLQSLCGVPAGMWTCLWCTCSGVVLSMRHSPFIIVPALLWPVLVTNPKYSTIWVTMKKINSIPGKTGRLLLWLNVWLDKQGKSSGYL